MFLIVSISSSAWPWEETCVVCTKWVVGNNVVSSRVKFKQSLPLTPEVTRYETSIILLLFKP